MMMEAAVHQRASFVTLTYEDPVAQNGSVQPRDLQLWLKRYRKVVGRFRYFGVGEYGDDSAHAHYHVCVFGRGREDMHIVRSTWALGRTSCTDLTVERAQYTAGYTVKKLEAKIDPRCIGRAPEFARMSLKPGIGAVSVAQIADALRDRPGWSYFEGNPDVPKVLQHGKRKMPIGRYIRTRLRIACGLEGGEPDEARFQRVAEVLNMWKDYVSDAELQEAKQNPSISDRASVSEIPPSVRALAKKRQAEAKENRMRLNEYRHSLFKLRYGERI